MNQLTVEYERLFDNNVFNEINSPKSYVSTCVIRKLDYIEKEVTRSIANFICEDEKGLVENNFYENGFSYRTSIFIAETCLVEYKNILKNDIEILIQFDKSLIRTALNIIEKMLDICDFLLAYYACYGMSDKIFRLSSEIMPALICRHSKIIEKIN